MSDLGEVGMLAWGGVGMINTPLAPAMVLPSTPNTVSGVVTDNLGAPAARIVRIVRRSDGLVVGEGVSDPVTGEYSLPATEGEVQRVVLDSADSPLLNDLIDRVISG